MSCSADWDARIERILMDEAVEGDWALLAAHRADCPACRARYDALATALAAFEGAPAGPAEAVRGHLEADLFAALDAARPRARARRTLLFGGGAVLAAAAALIVTLRPAAPPPTSPAGAGALTARGAGGSTDEAFRHEGIRVLCIDATADAATLRAVGAPGDGPAACARTDHLKLTASSGAVAGRHLTVFALDAEGALHWYWPRGDAPALGVDERDAPLPGSFDLSARAPAGAHRVYGVFTNAPLSRTEVEALTTDAVRDAVRARRPDAHVLTVDLELR